MLQTIAATMPMDRDYPKRCNDIVLLRAVLNGTLYDYMEHDFHIERMDSGDYIPIRSRKPCVRYGLARIVVEDSVSLLFSEGHFPEVQCKDRSVADLLKELIVETRLDDVMIEAAISGSVGSACILMRILKGRVFFRSINTEFLTPTWRADAPDTLESVRETYKVKGGVLASSGYDIDDGAINADFWFSRIWDDNAETWYVPVMCSLVADPRTAPVDTSRTVEHALGFVPMVWIKNLPGGSDIDGGCTFKAAIHSSIEIDYQLSQAARGLRYSQDPTLVIKEPAATDGTLVKGSGNALVVSSDGDAKLLEIGGTASAAVIEYVKELRAMALESVHGNRANADKLSAAQSGRALELMNQGLIWLADRLRASYGEHGLLPLLRLVVKASASIPISIMGAAPVTISDAERLTLKWPRWYQPTPEDRQADASTLNTLRQGGLMSRQTAVTSLADDYDIEDVDAEIALIAADMAAEDARQLAMKAAETATAAVET